MIERLTFCVIVSVENQLCVAFEELYTSTVRSSFESEKTILSIVFLDESYLRQVEMAKLLSMKIHDKTMALYSVERRCPKF